MVQLISRIEDPLDRARGLSDIASRMIAQSQSARALKLRETESAFDRERTQKLDAEDQIDRGRARARADVQDVQRAEVHERQIGAMDWQARRREIEDEQEQAAQEAQARLYSDALGIDATESTVPASVRKRLEAVRGQLAGMAPEEQRALVKQEMEAAREVILERRRGEARTLLESLASPDADTGEPLLDPQRAAKYAKMIDGGVDGAGRRVAPSDPDEVIGGLMDYVRARSEKVAHAELRQGAVARVDQAFQDAEGLSQQGARYGVSSSDPARMAKARALRHMLSSLPFDAKRSQDLEKEIYGLLFGTGEDSRSNSREPKKTSAFEIWRALPEGERSVARLRQLEREQEGGMGRFPTGSRAGGTPSGAPAGEPGEPEVPTPIADAAGAKWMQPAAVAPKDAFTEAVDAAFARLPAEKQTPQTRQALEVAMQARAQYDSFEEWERAAFGTGKPAAKSETKAAPGRLPLRLPSKGEIAVAKRGGADEDLVERIMQAGDPNHENYAGAPVAEWLSKNPLPRRAEPAERAAWEAKARKELGQWLGLK